MTAYYNEIDPYAAEWLRNLIDAGDIAPGIVDERSITDVKATDLKGFTQCHFFAGIGGWSLALRLAGWPDERPVWTGSCPCQPFSVAKIANGGAKGQNDERHLWPSFFSLISERNPPTIFGEQVTNAISWGWLDSLCIDLESVNYACASVVLPANSIQEFHERKRLFWVADSCSEGREGYKQEGCVLGVDGAQVSQFGDPFADARRAMDGDISHLRIDDGISIAVEQSATKGYGNAIVPQVAAEVIRAFMEVKS